MLNINKLTQSGMLHITVLGAASVLSTLLLFSNPAKAEGCPEVPTVSWWNNTSAELMTAYVDRNYDGDWTPYIQKLESDEKAMQDTLTNGQAVVIKSKKLVLKGEELARYIQLIGKRIEATRCIADEVIDTRLIEELNNMETAAGGNSELEISLVE